MQGQSSVLSPRASTFLHLYLMINQNVWASPYKKDIEVLDGTCPEIDNRGGERMEHKSDKKQLGVFSL